METIESRMSSSYWNCIYNSEKTLKTRCQKKVPNILAKFSKICKTTSEKS